MNEKPIIRSISSVPLAEVDRSRGAHIQILLGPQDEMPTCFTRRFTIEPGGRIPLHRHDSIEHEQIILEGEMLLNLDGEEVLVRAGDVVFIPAKVTHSYLNPGKTQVKFLCIVPARVDYGTDWLE